MKCTRCRRNEGTRGEMRFKSDAIVIVYLCEACAESVVREDEAVSAIVPSREE